jgi:hypothetical protein
MPQRMKELMPGRILMGNLPGAQLKVVIGLRKQEFRRQNCGLKISLKKSE